MTQKKKQKIKQIVMNVIHIVCYVLSAICLITYVVVAVNSCSSHKEDQRIDSKSELLPQQRLNVQKAQYNNTEYSVYESKYSGLSYAYLNFDELFTYYGISTGLVDSEDYTTRQVELPYGTQFIYDGVLHDTVRMQYNIATVEAPNGDYLYAVMYCYFLGVDGSRGNVITFDEYQDTTEVNDRYYKYQSFDIQIVLSQPIAEDNVPFYTLFQLGNESNFVFNKVFNYNAPAGTIQSNPYFTTAPFTSNDGGITNYIDYEVGYFISNGILYDTIRLEYLGGTGNMYFDINGSIKKGPTGEYTYYCTWYVNSVTNRRDVVNQRNQIAFMPTDASYGYYWDNNSTWKNDAFREVTFLTKLSEDLTIKINALNNNNQNTVNGYIGSGDTSDVFTLVGSAFTGLLPILSTTLLPGITIGMLLFIPLVALLVFAIIRIIKK